MHMHTDKNKNIYANACTCTYAIYKIFKYIYIYIYKCVYIRIHVSMHVCIHAIHGIYRKYKSGPQGLFVLNRLSKGSLVQSFTELKRPTKGRIALVLLAQIG